MNREKMAARRVAAKRARGRRAMFALEQLEKKLLMANDITIATGGSNTIPTGATEFSDTGTYTIDPSALTGSGTPVILEANDSITFTNNVIGMGEDLNAQSHGDIVVDANISTSTGNSITLDGTNSNTSGSVNQPGVSFDGVEVQSGGSLTVTGDGYAYDADGTAYGVDIVDSGLVDSGSSNTLSVTGGFASVQDGDDIAVMVGGGPGIISADSNITVTGTSEGYATDAGEDIGVYVAGGTISSVTGTVTVTGTGGSASTGNDNYGVLVYASGFEPDNSDPDNMHTGSDSTSAVITSTNGAVSVTGTGGGTTALSGTDYGVFVDTGGAIGTGDLGSVSVNGTGGVGGSGYNNGVKVDDVDSGPAAVITSGGGDVSVSGTGGTIASSGGG
jgi:hypothetical protein